MPKFPLPDSLNEYFPYLSRMVAKTSWLPNPIMVSALGGAAFPTARENRKDHLRTQAIVDENGNAIGMYDDNATPQWAVAWAHGLAGSRPKGWAVAHVWECCGDLNAYTHLANLVLVPESFSSLTDKIAVMTSFFRWHSWTVYKWKPTSANEPTKPAG
jgi:hypothetical protein